MPAADSKILIAVDPGRDKCGIAALRRDGTVIERTVISTESLAVKVGEIISKSGIEYIVCGDGTYSDEILKSISGVWEGEVKIIDERESTLQGRDLAWKESPPGGIFRFLPAIFRPDPPDLDSWAAVIIGRRALEKIKG